MKYLQFLLCLTLFTTVSHAQIQLGVRAGIHTGDLEGSDIFVTNRAGLDSLLIKGEDANVGFRIGAIARIRLGEVFYLQPEAVFRTSSAQYQIRDAFVNTDSIRFQEERFYLIDVPILAGLKFGPLRVQAGPIASIRLSKDSDLEKIESYQRSFQTAKWAFQFGFGLDLGKLALDINRQNYISGEEDEITIGGETFDLAGEGDFWVIALALYL